MDEDLDFDELPEIAHSFDLNAEQWRLVDWVTTPVELREEHVMTLTGWCDEHQIYPQTAMRWMRTEKFRRAQRDLALEKGLQSHQIGQIMETLYGKALTGDVSAARLWLNHNVAHIGAHQNPGPSSDQTPTPASVGEMDDAEIERMLEEMKDT